MPETLWYTRCPVPTASGLAFRRNSFARSFADSPYVVRNIKDLSRKDWDTHYSHSQNSSFREGGGSPPIWARSNGAATRLLALTFMEETLGIYVRSDDPARSLNDLTGRRFALPVWTRLVFDFFRFAAEKGCYSALRVHGMTESEVRFVDVVEEDDPHEFINPHSASSSSRAGHSYYHAQLRALIAGNVDAIFAKGGETANLEQEGAGAIRKLYDLATSPTLADRVNNSTPRLLTVSANLLKEHPEAVIRYVQTLIREARWAKENPNEARLAIAAEAAFTPERFAQCFEPDFAAKLMPAINEKLLESLRIMKSFLLERGYIRSDFSLDEWLAPDPLREALRRENLQSTT